MYVYTCGTRCTHTWKKRKVAPSEEQGDKQAQPQHKKKSKKNKKNKTKSTNSSTGKKNVPSPKKKSQMMGSPPAEQPEDLDDVQMFMQ